MDNKSKDSHSEDAVSTEENSEGSNEGENISISIPVNQQESSEERKKKKTVKQIIDEVLNCTIIQVPNQQEDETGETEVKVVKSSNKVVTVKEILGEILQYNVCSHYPPPFSTSSACRCGCDIPPYAPSTSMTMTRSEVDVSTSRDAPIYQPFQIFSSCTLQDTNLKTETLMPAVTIGRLLPSYSSVLRQGPLPKVHSTDSFVPKRPPPSYAEVEGIWDDVPSAVSSDSVMFGPDPLYVICPSCRIIVLTEVERERSAITHWIALILCIFLCWPCCLLPYYMKSCSYSYHSCPNCGHYFGMYNPF